MRRMRRITRFAMPVLAAVGLLLASAWAQDNTTGTVVGVVSDSSGGAIAGATVTLTDQATGASYTAGSNRDGRYVFQNVRLGTYSVMAAKTNFAQARVDGQVVSVSEATTVNFRLQVGASATTVEVTATEGAELQTMNATMGTALNADELMNLPNFGHDTASLLVYQGATTAGGDIAGQLYDQNTFLLDGGNNTDDMDGDNSDYNSPVAGSGSGVMPTPVESTEEVRVATNNETADFTGASGGEIMMVTKRGTNTWHGSGYEYLESSALGANTWGNDRLGEAKAVSHQNRFGGSLGGVLLPKWLGGKTYFYVNYEGRIFNNSATTEVTVPSAALRQGVLTFKNSSGAPITYNLATSTACGPAPAGQSATVLNAGTAACDPRGLGLDPVVAAYWNRYMPLPNDPTAGDQLNTEGYIGNVALPLNDKFVVGRFDHDFGGDWRMFVSGRWFDERAPSNSDLDFGGVVPGDTLGTITAVAQRPIQPDYWVIGLTGQLTPNVNNDFHFNYVRNWWQWKTPGVVDPIAGIPAGLSFDSSGSGRGLDAYDIGYGDVRQRAWNGHDWNYRDDVSWLKGNHLIQIGGTFSHYWDHFVRDDNGTSAVTGLRYIVGGTSAGTGTILSSNYTPTTCNAAQATSATAVCLSSGQTTNWNNLYYTVLGVVDNVNQVIARQGADLALDPPGAPAFDTDILDVPDLYFTDSWRLKPTFTLTLGLNYGVTGAPSEESGKQEALVDANGLQIDAAEYLATKATDALKGINYNPTLGFEPLSYYDPSGSTHMFPTFYSGLAPRISAAWNPNFNGGWGETLFGHNATVLRGGWSRLVDRTNGDNTVLTGLLGPGTIQTLTCQGAEMPQGGNPAACAGPSSVTAANAFRIGTDGDVAPFPALTPTLTLPVEPGVNAGTNSSVHQIDSAYRPGQDDEYSLSLQRQFGRSVILELGYVGRHGTHEPLALNLNTVPYMMTEGGETFAQAYANLALYQLDNPTATASSYPVQPYFEAALGGLKGGYCTAMAGANGCNGSVTAEIVNKESANLKVQSALTMWTDMENYWIFGPALVGSQGLAGVVDNTDLGRSNYNAGVISLTTRGTHGLTMNANFTYASALANDDYLSEASANNSQAVNPFDTQYGYGPVSGQYKYTLNLTANYQLPFHPGPGLRGRLLGGWSVSPLFVFHSGSLLEAGDSSQAYGQSGATSDALLTDASVLSGEGVQHIVAPTSIGSSGNTSTGLNYFSDPAAVYDALRPAILGYDTTDNYSFGYGPGFWNLNLSLTKDLPLAERLNARITAQATNVLNRVNFGNPSLSYTSSTSFGVVSGGGGARSIELGVRLSF